MLKYFKEALSIYSTSRQVRIKSRFLAITYLILVITVWCAYIGSLQFDLRKVYQKSCPVQGAMVSKVKGVLDTEDLDDSLFQVRDPKIYKRVYDTSDLIFPPYGGDGQDGGFIVITNLLITPNQTRSRCPELEQISEPSESNKSRISICNKDSDCKKGLTSPSSSGVLTGKCRNETGTCETSAWCPVEENILPLKGNKALLVGVKDFTVMLKNSVEFPDCGKNYHRRNILENATKKYLSECIYDINNDTRCPIFRIGDIVKWSGNNFEDVATTGGVFRIEARWTNCDFDWSFRTSDCFPEYSFSRIDESNAKISPGWNFRMASYHEEQRRTLKKMYGLKIIIDVTGEGKQFDFLTLILTLGATIGLFSVAPLACDFLFELLCALKRIHPFKYHFSDFTVKSRYQDSEDCRPPIANKTRFELSVSNNTIEESIGSYKPNS